MKQRMTWDFFLYPMEGQNIARMEDLYRESRQGDAM